MRASDERCVSKPIFLGSIYIDRGPLNETRPSSSVDAEPPRPSANPAMLAQKRKAGQTSGTSRAAESGRRRGYGDEDAAAWGQSAALNKWRINGAEIRQACCARLRRQRHIGSSCDYLELLAPHHARLLARAGAACGLASAAAALTTWPPGPRAGASGASGAHVLPEGAAGTICHHRLPPSARAAVMR
jgi:hypothetical protein